MPKVVIEDDEYWPYPFSVKINPFDGAFGTEISDKEMQDLLDAFSARNKAMNDLCDLISKLKIAGTNE